MYPKIKISPLLLPSGIIPPGIKNTPPGWDENLRLRSTNGMSICVSIGGNTIQFRDYGR